MGHLSDRNIFLPNSDLQVTLMLPIMIQVSWLLGSGEEAKNRFSRWRPLQPSWISDPNDFSYILIYKTPPCFLPSFKSIGLSVQEKKLKIDFKDGSHGGHLRLPIGTVLAIFDVQVTSMLPTKFQVNFGLVHEKKQTIDFQDGGHGSHLG